MNDEMGLVAFPEARSLYLLAGLLFLLNTSASGNYIAPFQHCLHHGAFVNYFESGAVKDSGYYNNGLKHDLWKEGARDGKESAFGYYRHGVREG